MLLDNIVEILQEKGTSYIEFADLRDLPIKSCNAYPYGLSIAVTLNLEIVAN